MDLPENAFQVAYGKLGQLIFENPGAGIAARLEFYIEIAFRPFDFDGETISPMLRLNRILTTLKKWSDLEKTALDFPNPPKSGSIDATIPLFRVQNPAEITQIRFGGIKEGTLQVGFDAMVDFEIEADSGLGQIPLHISCPLEVTPLKVATSLEKKHQSDLAAVTTAVANLVDLTAYGPLRKVPGGMDFPVLSVKNS